MKILLAVEHSDFSRAAIEAVKGQCQPSGCEVLVLHVLDSFSTYAGIGPIEPSTLMRLLDEERKAGEELVQSAQETLEAAGFQVKSMTRKGDAKSVILDVAAEWHPDLIVLGSHGRGGLDRFLLGSVSQAVARNSTCSVQIVRPAREERQTSAGSS